MWLALYRQSDPDTHLGGFYGNAIADSLGTLVIVIATKYLHETRLRRKPPAARLVARTPVAFSGSMHSLTIALLVTGVMSEQPRTHGWMRPEKRDRSSATSSRSGPRFWGWS